MTKLSSAFCTVVLASTSAFAGPVPTPTVPLLQPALGVDVLSDTKGVDLQPYMSHLISDLRQHWLPLVPQGQRRTASNPGETSISLTLAADGHVAAMHLDDTTHIEALDHAAWTATKETSYLPLPTEKNLADLKLRIHFVTNPQAGNR